MKPTDKAWQLCRSGGYAETTVSKAVQGGEEFFASEAEAILAEIERLFSERDRANLVASEKNARIKELRAKLVELGHPGGAWPRE